MKITFRVALLTFVGGALGTFFRWWLGTFIEPNLYAVAVVNLIGAFAIGFFNGHRYFHTDARRAFYAVGFCGGFTTLSSMMLGFLDGASMLFVILETLAGIGVYLLGRLTGNVGSVESGKEADLA
jgi:fluoride ion exporter CrcB/FEX